MFVVGMDGRGGRGGATWLPWAVEHDVRQTPYEVALRVFAFRLFFFVARYVRASGRKHAYYDCVVPGTLELCWPRRP